MLERSPILIVDDSEPARIFLEQTLRSHGFNSLLAVQDAQEALSSIDSFNPDLIILDVVMPGMDGLTCCEVIRRQEKHRDLPILISTGLTDEHDRANAFLSGATDFISKPFFPDELHARVIMHLQNRHYIKELRLYHERVKTELDSARELQISILPSAGELQTIRQEAELDVASYFKPSSEVGGDFWGIKNLHSGRTAFWMVDFSGHGVASALNAFRLQAYMKEHSSISQQPGEYLSHLNEKLLHLLLKGQFATMFYGVVDIPNDQLMYACAATPHPIILRKNGKVDILDGSGNPLGIGTHRYPLQTVPMHAGDVLILYSDALMETPGHDGSYIDEQKIAQLLISNQGLGADALLAALLAYYHKHCGSNSEDDLTLCICKREAR